MPKRFAVIVCLLIIAIVSRSARADAGHPACFAAIPPTLDGKLDDAAWQSAAVLVLTNQYRPDYPVSNRPRTEVRFCWDDAHLYAAFSCEDDDVWSFGDQPDSTLWIGDAFELFLKPSRDRRAYVEFVVAPNGTLYDALYPSRGAGGGARFKTWFSGARIATAVDGTDGDWQDTDRGYVVELAIPWEAFAEIADPPRAGDEWTFGAFRCEVSHSRDDTLMLMSIPKSGPTGFHSFEFYQPLRFIESSD